MQRSSLRRSIALAAGVALMAGTGPALGVAVPVGAALPTADPVPVAEAAAAVEYTSPKHVFTLNDVIGNAAGETDADDVNVIKDGDALEDFSTYSEDPFTAKTGGTLFPINSEFGFDVKDFVGATPKTFDNIAEEGWAGEFSDDDGSGVQFSDADTATMKAENLVGTWAAGLGGNEIKASTEHFTVMEAVMSCFQTIEYDYWASADDYAENPDQPVSAQRLDENCLENKLPNPVTDAAVAEAIGALVPNEDNIIPNTTDLYLGTNYSVTEKDDGKVLYRWGQAVKRPTDIRFTTTLDLPGEWADVPAGEKGFKVTKAELVLKHAVTNNPNDQIRPEDWENEGATGLTPEYREDADGNWVSTKDCYEGDGDFIPAGTVLRRPDKGVVPAPSSDLLGGYSAAWYTTIDRDPFEWKYETTDGGLVGSPVPDSTLGTLVSGPRWRMLSNKFGQDIPSLEIPAITCAAPPYEKGTVKYEVGDVVETTINLLDWSTKPENARWDDAASPLAYSAGWTTSWSSTEAADYVPGQMILDENIDRCMPGPADDGTCVTSLGTKLTDGFDVAFYVKGDKKPLKVYDVFIRLKYEGGTVTPGATTDFGDAPDTYGTADLSRTVGTSYLGGPADAELAAPATLDGTGDDTTGIDDEDGVTLPAVFPVGGTEPVGVTVVGDGVLDVEFDWNADGDFEDSDEAVAAGVLPSAFTEVTVPEGATPGATYARFVLTHEVDGVAVGEVEDYPITIAGYDFGDLPKRYGESDEGANPARHLIAGPSMKAIDAEVGPATGDLALGDDTAGIDDEDGVNLSKFVVGKSSTVRVSATGAANLRGWIDWNANGDFEEGELVISDSAIEGTRAFKVPVPADAVQGITFARFRISTAAEMLPMGALPDGEVEDHAITVTGKNGG